MELDYAPAARLRKNTGVWVLLWGVVSCAAALIALHFVQKNTETDIMSFTVKLIIPLGAMIVGLVAGIGFLVGSLVLGTRVRGWLVWSIVGVLIACYFGAQYIEFAGQGPMFHRDTGARVGFLEYYDLTTRLMTWEPSSPSSSSSYSQHQSAPEPLGATGYFYRGLGILGFVLGGVIPALTLRLRPYCDLCQRYMKTKSLFRMPAAAPLAKFRVKKQFTFDTPEHKEQMQQSLDRLNQLRDVIKSGDASATATLLSEKPPKAKGKIPLFATLKLQHCRQCRQGTLIGAFEAGENIQTPLARPLFQDQLSSETVDRLTARS